MKNIFSIIAVVLFSIATLAVSAAGEYNLENVTGDATVRWIVTSSDALGHASVSYSEGNFSLHAGFSGLADPLNDDFYEGWLVQKSPFKFISTGELEKVDGKYINDFTSTTDYTSYDFYVLTLEPNDGDPAPADHIFEGTVIMHDAMMMEEDKMMEKENTDTTMMKDEDVMMKWGDKMMMKDSPLKISIRERVGKISLSVEKIDIVLERIENLETRLPTLSISEAKKESYIEILTALTEVLLEKKTSMMSDTMMEK